MQQQQVESLRRLASRARGAEALYRETASAVGDNVVLHALAVGHDVAWLCSGDCTDQDDAYYAREVERLLRTSAEKLVEDALRVVSALPGLEDEEFEVRCATDEVSSAKYELTTLLTSLLLAFPDEETECRTRLDAATERVRNRVVTSRRMLLKAHVASLVRIREVFALCDLKGATSGVVVDYLTYNAARSLRDALSTHGASLEVLRSCVAPTRGTAPMCGTVRSDVLRRWFIETATAMPAACDDALRSLHRRSLLHDSAIEWHGLCPLWPRTADTPAGGAQAPVLSHLVVKDCDGSDLPIRTSADGCQTQVATRALRLAYVVRGMVTQGRLPSRTVAAHLLLPIVARYTAETERALREAQARSPPPSDVPAPPSSYACLSVHDEAEPVHTTDTGLDDELRNVALDVPPDLRRDFVLLVALERAVRNHPPVDVERGVVRVRSRDVIRILSTLSSPRRASGDVTLQSIGNDRSYRQTVPRLLRKLVNIGILTSCGGLLEGDVRFDAAAKELVILSMARYRAIESIETLRREMRSPNVEAIRRVWHVSRFTKSRRRRDGTQ